MADDVFLTRAPESRNKLIANSYMHLVVHSTLNIEAIL